MMSLSGWLAGSFNISWMSFLLGLSSKLRYLNSVLYSVLKQTKHPTSIIYPNSGLSLIKIDCTMRILESTDCRRGSLLIFESYSSRITTLLDMKMSKAFDFKSAMISYPPLLEIIVSSFST